MRLTCERSSVNTRSLSEPTHRLTNEEKVLMEPHADNRVTSNAGTDRRRVLHGLSTDAAMMIYIQSALSCYRSLPNWIKPCHATSVPDVHCLTQPWRILPLEEAPIFVHVRHCQDWYRKEEANYDRFHVCSGRRSSKSLATNRSYGGCGKQRRKLCEWRKL